jgi:hypothetical protein
MDDGEERLRERLEGLAPRPGRAAVERRLVAVVRQGRRRRQRRQVAGVAGAAAAVVLVAGLGRVDGGSLQVGGRPAPWGTGTRDDTIGTGPRPVHVPGSPPPADPETTTTVTTVTTTATTRPPIVGPTLPPTSVTAPLPEIPSADAPDGCSQVDARGANAVVDLNPGVGGGYGTCITVSRGSTLRVRESGFLDGLRYLELMTAGDDGESVARVAPRSTVTLGPVDEVLPDDGGWGHFELWFEFSDHGRGTRGHVYIRAQ